MTCDTKFTMGWPPRKDAPFWLTIGNFDGVHLGHQALIHEVSRLAKEEEVHSMLVNFWPHPRVYFTNAKGFYLTTRGEKTGILSRMGIDEIVTLAFDEALANLSAEVFLRELADHVNVRGIIVGANFGLGKGRQGTPDVLAEISQKLGIDFRVFAPVMQEGDPVSSTRIRAALNEGRVDEVSRLLGRPYAICSEVVGGQHVGRTLGIPTANLALDPDKFLPRLGVYATLAHLRQKVYPAVTSVGVRPTFGDHFKVSVETLILDFDDDIYGEDLRVAFIEWLRPEEKFESAQALVQKIEEDKILTRRIFEDGFE